MHDVRRYPTADAMAADLARLVRTETDADLARHGRATLVLSGGRTPRTYLAPLARAREDWRGVDITLCDERLVPVDHADSNEGAVRKHFAGTAARIVGLRGAAMTAEQAAADASIRLVECFWPAAVSILGFGPDGHTASLFPGGDVDRAGAVCIATRRPDDSSSRVSMSFHHLLRARRIVVVSGPEKAAMLRALAVGELSSDLPIVRLQSAAGNRLQHLSYLD